MADKKQKLKKLLAFKQDAVFATFNEVLDVNEKLEETSKEIKKSTSNLISKQDEAVALLEEIKAKEIIIPEQQEFPTEIKVTNQIETKTLEEKIDGVIKAINNKKENPVNLKPLVDLLQGIKDKKYPEVSTKELSDSIEKLAIEIKKDRLVDKTKPESPELAKKFEELIKKIEALIKAGGLGSKKSIIGGWGSDQVTITSSALPTGAATSANQETTNNTLSQLVMSVENALSVAAYDLNAASYSGSTTITDDYLLDSIEFDFTTAISKTISVTTSTGAEIFTSTDSYQSIILTRNDLGQACNANDNITITVTQTAGACSMDLKVKIMKGSNTLVGNPTVKLQGYSPEESAYEEVRSVDNSMFVINYLDAVGIGIISGHVPFRGFGQRQSLSTATAGDDIWEGTATTIPIPPDAGDLMSLVSDSAQDGVAGTGVRSVDVHYIDPTGNPQSTIVTMNGTTAVNTGILMRFIQSIHTETVGSNGTAVGTVSIYKTGDVTTVYNVIKPGGNVSLSSARMVPLGKTFYIKDTFLSGAANKSISVRLRVTSTFEDVLNPRVFQYKEISFLQDATKSSNKSVVIKAPALSIIKYTAYSSQAGGDISTSYEGWYE